MSTPTEIRDPIALATRRGATFNQLADGTWECDAPIKRGRPLPMACCRDADKAEAARMLCAYFNFKE